PRRGSCRCCRSCGASAREGRARGHAVMKAIAAGGPDGLIDPAAWPIRAEDVADTTGYEFAAATLRRITSEIETHALDLGATWKALPGAYQAPELEQALAIMPPVGETATGGRADLDAAAGALERLATALQGIYPRLAALQARAEAFRSDVAGGVLMERVSGGGAASSRRWSGITG